MYLVTCDFMGIPGAVICHSYSDAATLAAQNGGKILEDTNKSREGLYLFLRYTETENMEIF